MSMPLSRALNFFFKEHLEKKKEIPFLCFASQEILKEWDVGLPVVQIQACLSKIGNQAYTRPFNVN
jgi:hypothetical protein